METITKSDRWINFRQLMQKKCSKAEFENWIAPIDCIEEATTITLEVPNIFVQKYLLDNYGDELKGIFGCSDATGPEIDFAIKAETRAPDPKPIVPTQQKTKQCNPDLNRSYTLDSFIEGPSNQFIKSAAVGIASKPGKTYNPLFIHGGVGLGKTHLLHGIGHYAIARHKRLKVECITTEGFIHAIVNHLKTKSIDKLKRHYRSVDLLLVDDIQFLQNRLNFEEEFCNTFEALINQSKQLVITSDKPPGQLQLSERIIARMEWGLVAHMETPDLETRVAILQYKADALGLPLPYPLALYIAEHIYTNVRQLEGAINRLSAHCFLMNATPSQELIDSTLSDLFQSPTPNALPIEMILERVSKLFNIHQNDLKGQSRLKEFAYPRQIAMYLAKEYVNAPLNKIASYFGGKTHSTLLHAWKKIKKQMATDPTLKSQIQMTKKSLGL